MNLPANVSKVLHVALNQMQHLRVKGKAADE